MQKITPFLWFDHQAEQAANFYTSIFKNSKIKETTRYTGEEPVGEKGARIISVETVSIGGQHMGRSIFILIRAVVYAAIFVGLLLVYAPSRLLSAAGIVRPPVMGAAQIAGMHLKPLLTLHSSL
jgi:3-demethylubiquinone-9 3-methyltransferase